MNVNLGPAVTQSSNTSAGNVLNNLTRVPYTYVTLPPANSVQPYSTAYTTDQGLVYSTGTVWLAVNNSSIGPTLQLPYWRRALANVRAGAAPGKVVCIGDSTTAGLYSNGSQFINSRVKSYHNTLSGMLTGMGINSSVDSFWGDQNFGVTNYAASDPRVTIGSSFTTSASPISPLGKNAFIASTATNSFDFAPVNTFDTVDIYYGQYAAGGTFTIAVDGGAVIQTVNAAGANNIAKVTVTGIALATHTINMKWASGGVFYLCALAVRNSTLPKVEVYGCGISGGLAEDYQGTAAFTNINELTTVAPDLTVINLTINDIQNNTFSAAVYSSALQNIITAARLSGDVIMMIGNPTNSINFVNGNYLTYVNAVYALAAANGVPLLDINQRWVSYAFANSLSYYGDGIVHPNGTGYADIAQLVRNLITAT